MTRNNKLQAEKCDFCRSNTIQQYMLCVEFGYFCNGQRGKWILLLPVTDSTKHKLLLVCVSNSENCVKVAVAM